MKLSVLFYALWFLSIDSFAEEFSFNTSHELEKAYYQLVTLLKVGAYCEQHFPDKCNQSETLYSEKLHLAKSSLEFFGSYNEEVVSYESEHFQQIYLDHQKVFFNLLLQYEMKLLYVFDHLVSVCGTDELTEYGKQMRRVNITFFWKDIYSLEETLYITSSVRDEAASWVYSDYNLQACEDELYLVAIKVRLLSEKLKAFVEGERDRLEASYLMLMLMVEEELSRKNEHGGHSPPKE